MGNIQMSFMQIFYRLESNEILYYIIRFCEY